MKKWVLQAVSCLMVVALVATTTGCGKKKKIEDEPASEASTQKINISIGAIQEGDLEESQIPQSGVQEFTPGKAPQVSEGKDTGEGADQGASQMTPIPGSSEEVKGTRRQIVSSKEVTGKVEFSGLNLPMYSNWTSYPLEETKYFCGGMGECYTVEPAQKYEVNESVFSMFYGGTANYAMMQVAVLSHKTAVALMQLNPDGVPYLMGHIYTLEGEEPLLFRIENYSLTEDEMWEYIWSVVKGLGLEAPAEASIFGIKGKQKYTPKKELQWTPEKEYTLPKMNYSVREDLKYGLPTDWKLVEINGVVSSNSVNGQVRFEMAKYNSNLSVAGEFGNLLGQFVNNGQAVTRVKTYEDPKGLSEVIAVGSNVMLVRIYTDGQTVYRCVISYNADSAKDSDKWLALQVFAGIEYAGQVPTTTRGEVVPQEYGEFYELDEDGNPILPEETEESEETEDPEGGYVGSDDHVWDRGVSPTGGWEDVEWSNPGFDGE